MKFYLDNDSFLEIFDSNYAFLLSTRCCIRNSFITFKIIFRFALAYSYNVSLRNLQFNPVNKTAPSEKYLDPIILGQKILRTTKVGNVKSSFQHFPLYFSKDYPVSSFEFELVAELATLH